MTDRYIAFANPPVSHRLVDAVSLLSPLCLERWQAGRVRSMDGPLVIGGGGALVEAMLPFAGKLTDAVFTAVEGQFELLRRTARHNPRAKAVLLDTSGLTRFEQLVALCDSFQLVLKSLDKCLKVVVLERTPKPLKDPVAASVQRNLEGFARSLGKEIRRGGSVQLLYVGKGAENQLEDALRFFLSPKSACVSGQAVRLTASNVRVHDWSRLLAGQRALVTGATHDIGAAIAGTLTRDGAEVVLLDVPPTGEALEDLATRLGGRAVALDICAADAGQQLVDTLPEGVDIVMHNAGVTRDKTLAKMSSDLWNSVINVDLNTPQVLAQALLDGGKLRDNDRMALLASISGIAGNLGQNNYAVSEVGLIGLAQTQVPALGEHGTTINAVAPEFIETQMTAAIPLTIRKAGRRMSSMSQGGLPQDVAETVAWFAQPSSSAVSDQMLRVCGQSLLRA